MHYATIVGGVKQEQFDDFIQALVNRDFGQPMVPYHDRNKCCIIFDNAPCHRGVEERLADSVPEDLQLVRLPSYSCPLNPIDIASRALRPKLNSASASIVLFFQKRARPLLPQEDSFWCVSFQNP